ncbi:MAG: 5-dehydro-2-deoxygluconokinase [Methylobacteriaceae bacterium]|jgi:5-dehydro-2-deoxygluconokinase|nr:5-dehydro-2-deoxygluconokinase [Methylobacteriaceae bacterium]
MAIHFDTTRPLDIILLGRVAVDFNPVDMYKPLSRSTTYKKYIGGSPANIAFGMARLGKKCGFFARVSDDQLGDFAIEEFTREGIDTSHIKRAEHGEKIGLTFTEVLDPNTSSILMYRNQIADLALHVDDIDEAYIKTAKALLISGTSLAESPSREAALKAIMLAVRTGTPVIFDIDYRAYNWKNRDEMSIYYSLAAREACIILGSREEYDLTEALIKDKTDDAGSAQFWFGKKAEIVVIKHGKEGSFAYTKDGRTYMAKPFPVEPIKGFGGGDGYASAFLYGLMEGLDIMQALELGSASASILVGSHGCSIFMPTLPELKAFIAEKKAAHGEMIFDKS